MRTNIFKIFRIIIATMIGSMSTMIGAMPAQAASTDVNQCEIVDYNIAYYDSLTTICPDEIMYPDTTSIPTNSKDISTGAYYFSGQSYYDTLYTKYKFYGKSSYTIHVVNNGSTALTVKAKSLTKTYASTVIAVGASTDLSLSGMDASTKFYISFSSDYNTNVSGYIK